MTIVISRGPQFVDVPKVVGQSEGDAIDNLHRAGLKVLIVPETSSTAVGDVLKQVPGAGTSVRPGTTVRITVGK